MKLSERLQAVQTRSEVPGAPLHVPPVPKHSPAAPIQVQPTAAAGAVAQRPISGLSTYQTRAARRAAEAAAQAAAAFPSVAPVQAAPAPSAPTTTAVHRQSAHTASPTPTQGGRQ